MHLFKFLPSCRRLFYTQKNKINKIVKKSRMQFDDDIYTRFYACGFMVFMRVSVRLKLHNLLYSHFLISVWPH